MESAENPLDLKVSCMDQSNRRITELPSRNTDRVLAVLAKEAQEAPRN